MMANYAGSLTAYKRHEYIQPYRCHVPFAKVGNRSFGDGCCLVGVFLPLLRLQIVLDRVRTEVF